MAYRFLKLDPIPNYVDSRLQTYTDNKQVSELGVWVKFTSGAGESESSAGLTIVSNPNIPTFGVSSIHGALDREAPIGSKSFDGNPNSYSEMNPDGIGYRPRPIIESVTITNATRGLSRKAEFEIKCYTQNQVDQITQYFLEPGFTVCIEWGWNVSESYQQISRTIDEIADLQNFDEIERRREASNGTYDSYFGIVTGGNISQSDGSYTVSVECKGTGEVFSQIQQQNNSSTDESDDEEETSDIRIKIDDDVIDNQRESFARMFNDLPAKYRTDRVRSHINNDEVSHHSHFINFLESVTEDINKKTKSSRWWQIFSSGTVQIDGRTVKVPSGDGIVDTTRFIRFGVLIEILQSHLYHFSEGVELANNERVPIHINSKNIPITAFPKLFSMDGSKLYVPNAWLPDFGLTAAFDDESIGTIRSFSDIGRARSISENNTIDSSFNSSPFYNPFPRFTDLDDSDFQADAGTYGYLEDLYINFDFAVSVLSKKGLSYREVILEMLNGMSSAVNNLWDFQITEDVITDESGDTSHLQLSIVDYEFKGFTEKVNRSYVSNGVNSPFESFSLDVDIPGAMMGQIVGRRLSGNKPRFQTELDELPNTLFGDGVQFQDFIVREMNKRTASSAEQKEEPTGGGSGDEEQADVQRNFEYFMKTASIIHTVTDSSQNVDSLDITDYVFGATWNDDKLFSELRKEGNNNSTSENGLSPLLPITASWTTFGLSGIRNGLTFRILDIPNKYKGRGMFQITEVSHTISGMTWKTSVEGKFRQSSGDQ